MFCVRFLHRMPGEIDLSLEELYRTMVAMDVSAAAGGSDRHEVETLEELFAAHGMRG